MEMWDRHINPITVETNIQSMGPDERILFLSRGGQINLNIGLDESLIDRDKHGALSMWIDSNPDIATKLDSFYYQAITELLINDILSMFAREIDLERLDYNYHQDSKLVNFINQLSNGHC